MSLKCWHVWCMGPTFEVYLKEPPPEAYKLALDWEGQGDLGYVETTLEEVCLGFKRFIEYQIKPVGSTKDYVYFPHELKIYESWDQAQQLNYRGKYFNRST